MNTEQELRDKITELDNDVKKYRTMNNKKNNELILLRDYKKEVERIAKNDKLWNDMVKIDTLKTLITKQDLILREYKGKLDKIKLACPKWQLAELEEILSPTQNGFDIND